MMKDTFGGSLKALRAQKRMGLRELGRAIGISAMHISNLEKGKSMPSAELVERLATELKGDLDALLHLADQIDPAVVDVIQSNPQVVPSFLRSASNLTPAQWEKLQKQVLKMSKENDKK
jgi:transcriptional regulator with XRE-family HTH domain